MENLKKNLFAKVIVFILVQVFVLGIVFSSCVVVFNAGYNFYSSSYEDYRKTMCNELLSSFENELFGDVYYMDEYLYEYLQNQERIKKGNPLPEGLGYEVHFDNASKQNLNNISLQKNVDLLKGKPDVYVSETKHDIYRIKTYLRDPLETGLPAEEIYTSKIAAEYKMFNTVYSWRYVAVVCVIVFLVLFVLAMTFLLSAIRHGKNEDRLSNKIPADLAGGAAAALIALVVYVAAHTMPYFSFDDMDLAVLIAGSLVLLLSVLCTGYICFFVSKIGNGNWWKTSLIYLFVKVFKKMLIQVWGVSKKVASVMCSFFKMIPHVWKTVLGIVIIMISNFAIAMNLHWSGFAFLCWAFGAVLISVGVVYISLCMRRLKIGGEKLAGGDLEYKVEKKGLFLDFADHADNLNSISKGMAAAVHEKLKSERFKTELITNVSHDIKTPLTSIINYVDLLKKENIEDEKINEYIEVLDRQSSRLKKLTEDIVDASKASTGNVKIDLAPCKVGLLISQTVGDYKDKAENENLDFIIKLPEDDLKILADGRRLWRVFDNLLNNICKYSQSGTRVYITLEESGGKAVVTYRNVSRYELDITEEELMERFVRGDKSRNTEGSGLGLSIARNLVELQGGEFDIVIDGDLFKVIVKFDVLNL